jgi:hypothetical protein
MYKLTANADLVRLYYNDQLIAISMLTKARTWQTRSVVYGTSNWYTGSLQAGVQFAIALNHFMRTKQNMAPTTVKRQAQMLVQTLVKELK